MSASLDHLVLACSDLAATVAWFAEATGVTPATGGSHVGRGTTNALVGLTGPRAAYLEIVGPDPEQLRPATGRWLGVEGVTAPTLTTWAVRPDDLDRMIASARERGYDPGAAASMSRDAADGTRLRWRLTPPTFPASGGLVPFLVDWGVTAHPTTRGLPSVELVDLRAEHPDPASVNASLAAIDVDLAVTPGQTRLSALLRTPRGDLRL